VNEATPLSCSLGTRPTCRLTEGLGPYASMEVRIGVVVEGATSGEINEARVSGGNAPSATARHSIVVSGEPTPFGVEEYDLTPEEEGGAPSTQAGIHPFQLTTTLMLNQTAD